VAHREKDDVQRPAEFDHEFRKSTRQAQDEDNPMFAPKNCVRVAAIALSLLAISDTPAQAQATSKAQAKKAAAKAEPGVRRLPPGYGQLELSDDQREKVYGVQEKYATDLAKLNQQIADLRAKISTESEAVLTPAQRTQLNRYRAEAKSKTKAAPKEEPKAKAKTKN
jgi:Spy/CpxP family protein refolding chaperone